MDQSVSLAGLNLKNPVMTASGTAGYGTELAGYLDLAALGEPEPFDGAMVVGNVMDFVTPDAQAAVIERLAAHLRPDGFLVVGCRTVRGFTPDDLDAALPGTGLELEQRFATYDLRPWTDDAGFCVSVLRAR